MRAVISCAVKTVAMRALAELFQRSPATVVSCRSDHTRPKPFSYITARHLKRPDGLPMLRTNLLAFLCCSFVPLANVSDGHAQGPRPRLHPEVRCVVCHFIPQHFSKVQRPPHRRLGLPRR